MSELKLTTDNVRAMFLDEPEFWMLGAEDKWLPGPTKKNFDIWLAEHDRQVAEKAWEEGHATALRYAAYFGEHVPNPHQQGDTE